MSGLRFFLLPLAYFLFSIQEKSEAVPFSGLDLIREGNEEPTKINYRLPGEVVPESYKIKLTPKLRDDFTFEGESTIIVTAKRNTNSITLHSKNIKIHENETIVTVSGIKKNVVHKYEIVQDFLILELESAIQNNTEVNIFLKYTGKLNDDLRGFYRSSYVENGEKK